MKSCHVFSLAQSIPAQLEEALLGPTFHRKPPGAKRRQMWREMAKANEEFPPQGELRDAQGESHEAAEGQLQGQVDPLSFKVKPPFRFQSQEMSGKAKHPTKAFKRICTVGKCFTYVIEGK